MYLVELVKKSNRESIGKFWWNPDQPRPLYYSFSDVYVMILDWYPVELDNKLYTYIGE